ncbi:MAG: hypothetical protein JWL70_1788 [Acidimicrobiia bacterium]|nr:hypothetical protein [Acidimicrobiia bacterium]
MNLLAHAEVARRLEFGRPEHLAGAMLPDLAGIAQFRIPALEPGPLADGVALHHRTDDVFHRSWRFQRWCVDTTRALTAAGMSRGAARASAHLGAELLIDGELVRITDVADAAEAALRHCRPEIMAMAAEASAQARIEQVLDWIVDGGLRAAYVSPIEVSLRIERVLSRRPRLALEAGGQQRCAEALTRLDLVVAPLVPVLIDETMAPLAAPGPSR